MQIKKIFENDLKARLLKSSAVVKVEILGPDSEGKIL